MQYAFCCNWIAPLPELELIQLHNVVFIFPSFLVVFRFSFLVEEDNTPVAIVVTPCSARIEWNLSLLDPPEDGSGSSKNFHPLINFPEHVHIAREQDYVGLLRRS